MLTITEALAEVKTTSKRIQKKQEAIMPFLFRQDTLKDPLDNQGGSKEFIRAERQAIADLNARLVRIRAEIQKANANQTITIANVTRSIADWLVWRREVAPGLKGFTATLRQQLTNMRTQAQQKGIPIRGANEAPQSVADVVVNLDERALSEEIEAIEEMLGVLDGQLSLKNATVTIDV